MRYLAPILGLLLISVGAFSEPALAQPNRARQGVQNGEVRSLDQILNGIRRERPGSLADVQGPEAGPSGEPHYRLKWVTPDGRVQWLDTDARTGRVLGVQGDRPGGPIPGPSRPGFRPQADEFAPRGNFEGPRGFGRPGIPPEAEGPSDPRFRGPVPSDPRGRFAPPRGNFEGPSGGFGRFGAPPPEAEGPADPRFRGPAPSDPRGRFVPRGGFERGPGNNAPPARNQAPPQGRERGGFFRFGR
ncbi:MAG TPA: hypothetical protein VEU06_08185 [Micropepsaceae bacterium]|nr:hypothetical protein [Micropepsaceae bacterium]